MKTVVTLEALSRALFFLFASVLPSFAQTSRLGVFDQEGDIGAVNVPGSSSYDAEKQEYTIQSSGTNMWGDHDEFHFVWKKLKGDFILQAMIEFVGEGADPHRKVGIIVRQSLDPRSPHINACRHGDGLTSLQFRRAEGAPTEETRFELKGPDVLQLARKGPTYTMSVAHFGDVYTSNSISDVDLGDEVYVGVYVCSHNNAVSEKAILRNVKIVRPVKATFVPYHDYIGSDLELLDPATGHRKVIYHVNDSLQAPNWTPDGKALVYNHNGLIYRFDLASGQPRQIKTGAVTACNNDHALSFDGKILGISGTDPKEGHDSLIYTLPIGGGTPKKITPIGLSYLHGWSPDGKYLVFTGSRNGEFDIYRVLAEGGKEERLTTAKGLDDGSEYSPDGNYIYFNSNRTGKMQIWRMKADGSDQEQLTNDEFNNWFPHVSPDGKTINIVTFPADIDPGAHPFYKHVYLRHRGVKYRCPHSFRRCVLRIRRVRL